MVTFKSRRVRIGAGAAILLGLGVAGGAGAVALTRPAIEMAPTVPTAIAKLPQSEGVVTVRGKVAEVFGDRFVVQDATGRMMVNAGREGRNTVARGAVVMVQGRYDDGQMRASYLVDADGKVEAVGPGGRPPHDRHGPGHEGPGHEGPGREGPTPDGPPPPPPGCAPAPTLPAGPPAPPAA